MEIVVSMFKSNIRLTMTHLGLIKCLIASAIARPTNSADDATYAQPKNGFFPPIHDTVEMTTDFVPLYDCTG